jgi:branched-chain amino acid transport system ATP-binding protein
MTNNAIPLLEIQEVHTWYGESHVLHGVTMQMHEGETVALLGRNGAGKTTTLRSIMGVTGFRKGSIRMRGKELLSLPSHKIARLGIGYVPEERGIFSGLNVVENLMLPPVVAPGGMSLEAIYDLFPNLLERKFSPGTKLSGGEQQMLAMARILRTGARVILLDEPTEGLAPVIVQRIGEIIAQLKSDGYAILLVEQNFRFAAQLADRHYVMDEGKVVEQFSREQLDDNIASVHRYLEV